MRGSDYVELRAFTAIVEHGSFVRAAAYLGVTPSALSQTIRGLEERLGVRLLNRTTRSVAPSDAGTRLLKRLLPAFADLDTAVEEITAKGETPSGILRINASRVAAMEYLAPLLGPFLVAYPHIKLDIIVDDRLVDVVAGGFDAGIRLGEKLEKDMIALPFGGNLSMQVVAAPAYLEHYAIPQHPRDLRSHRCLSYYRPTDGSTYRWEFERDGQKLKVEVDGPLIVNAPEMLPQIVVDGAGINYLFTHQVEHLIAAGKLIPLLSEWTPPFLGFYIYYPSRAQMPVVLRTFLDFIYTTQSGRITN